MNPGPYPQSSYQPYNPQPDYQHPYNPQANYQQPYNPQANQQNQYQYQQPVPTYNYGVPPPVQKKKTSTIIIVVVVVLIVVFVIVPVVASFLLISYMNDFSSGPGTTVPSASIIPTQFTNPSEGTKTTNGGGWNVRVSSVSTSSTKISTLSFKVLKNGITVYAMNGISTSTADISYLGSYSWYLKKEGSSSVVWDDNGQVKTLTSSNTKDLAMTDSQTLQGAAFVFFDTDGSGTLSAGDLALVYSDPNGDGVKEITPGMTVEISSGGLACGSTALS